MADTVKEVRIYQNGIVTGDYGIEAETVEADNVQLADNKTLKDVLIDSEGHVIDVSSTHLDETYLVTNDDGEGTLNTRDNGIGVITGKTISGSKIITPINEFLGVIGDEGGTNFNTKTGGIAPMDHSSALNTYGAATSTKYGHVKIAQSRSEIPSDVTGVALGAGLINDISGGTYIDEASYEAAGASVLADGVTYYVYTENDLVVGMARILELYKDAAGYGTLATWNLYYADSAGSAAYDFVNEWWATSAIPDAYYNLVLNGKYKSWVPTKPSA